MRVNQGFLAGVVWGGVVAGLGLAVISQVAPGPMPAGVEVVVADPSTGARELAVASEPVAPPGPAPAGVPGAAATVPQKPEPLPEPLPKPQPEPKPEPQPATVPAEVPELPAAPVPVAPDAGKLAVASQPPSGPAVTGSAARPDMPVQTAPADPDRPAGQAPAPAPATDPRVASNVPRPAPDELLLTPPPAPAPAPAPSRIVVAPDPVPDPVPEATPLPQTTPPAPDAAPQLPLVRPLPVPEAAPEVAPAAPVSPPVLQPVRPIIAEEVPRRLAPDPALPGTDSVRVGQLPRIGDAGAAPEASSPAGDVPGTESADTDAPPVQRFARAFDNPDGKPLFSVVLRDTGEADLDRAVLAQIAFPVTFVIDPMQPGAAQAAEIYRRGGQEVLMLASGIPDGATPGDLEQTFQSLSRILPEAVGVMDQPASGFQGNRPLAAQVVPILAAQGRGLVTFDVGLNAADQEARRAALPAAMIFRQLDAQGEEAPVIRRYLDRAAFKAAQEGRVVVLGDTRPETVAALLEWAVEGRAASVALAPVTAVMGAP